MVVGRWGMNVCLAGLLHVADWWVHRALRLAVAVDVTARDVTNAMFTCQRQANPPGQLHPPVA